MMMLRMSWAFRGTSSPSAFSTERTDAIACTVVQTPQMRWVKTQASRGSRPCRMVSMPRHMVPLDQASLTAPPSTSTSMRRWPSIRVTGSIVMSLLMSCVLSGDQRSPATCSPAAGVFAAGTELGCRSPGDSTPLRIGKSFTNSTNTAIPSAASPALNAISPTCGK